MIDSLNDLDARCWGNGVSTELFAVIIIIRSVELVCARGWVAAFGNLDLGDL
jgi:hypothetical protein